MKKPFVFQMMSRGKWYEIARFHNREEAEARMQVTMKRNVSTPVRVVDEGATEAAPKPSSPA